jgi:hypothetical protein
MLLKEGNIWDLKFVFSVKSTYQYSGVTGWSVRFNDKNNVQIFTRYPGHLDSHITKVLSIFPWCQKAEKIPYSIDVWTPNGELAQYGTISTTASLSLTRID